MAKELGLSAHVASHQELCVLFRLCRDQSDTPSLSKTQFCELLCRCAILWCGIDEHSEVPTGWPATDRMAGLGARGERCFILGETVGC